MAKLTPAQQYVIDKLNGKTLMPPDTYDNNRKCYIDMPYIRNVRTYEALERKGLIKYVSIDDGWKQNGYVLDLVNIR